MGEWIDFAAVKAAVRMEKLLEEYGIKPGRRIGMCLRGRCPLPQHGSRESGESFMVNTQKNVWACHSQSCVVARGGQRGGNVLDFVAAMENCSIAQAARRLRARWGVGGGIRPLREDGWVAFLPGPRRQPAAWIRAGSGGRWASLLAAARD